MHTETGRIYSPEETEVLAEVARGTRSTEARIEELRSHGLTPADAHDLAAGVIVPVSERVAQQMKLGQRELERRRRRRQAAKQARRRNR